MVEVSEKIYKKIVERALAKKIPIYPAHIRKPALERYRREETARIKREQKVAKQKYEKQVEASRERERRYWRRLVKQREAVAEARALPAGGLHSGSWVRLDKKGNVVGGAGIAAMSPDAAKARGYKWGTTANGKFVSMPSQRPGMSEYFGYLKWKYDKGDYDRVPATKELIRKEIAKGRAQHGVRMPTIASPGVDMKRFEAQRRTIKQAYQQGAAKLLAEKKTTEAQIIKAKGKMSTTDFEELQNLSTNPTVMKHVGAQEHFKGLSERGGQLSYSIAGYKELQNVLQTREKEYAKGGWTPEEIGKFNTLSRQVSFIGSGLGERIQDYNLGLRTAQRSYKQDVGYGVMEAPSVIKYQRLGKGLAEAGGKVEGYRYMPKIKGYVTEKSFKIFEDQTSYFQKHKDTLIKLRDERGFSVSPPKLTAKGFSVYPSSEFERIKETVREGRKIVAIKEGAKVAAVLKPPKERPPTSLERVKTREDVLVGGLLPEPERGVARVSLRPGVLGPIVSPLIVGASKAARAGITQVGKVKPVIRAMKPVEFVAMEKIYEPIRRKIVERKVVLPIYGEVGVKRIPPTEPTIAKRFEEWWTRKAIVPISARIAGEQLRKIEKQQKVVEKEITDVARIEKQYRKKGYITGVGPMSEFVGPEKEFKAYQREIAQYDVAQKKLEEIPKPSPWRQFPRGVTEMGLMLPLVPGFVARGVTFAARRPAAVPVAAVRIAKEYKEFAKVEPWRFVGHVAGMAIVPKVVKLPKYKRFPTGVRVVGLGFEVTRPLIRLRRPIGGEIVTYKPIVTAVIAKRPPIPIIKKGIVPKVKARIPEVKVRRMPKVELERLIGRPTKAEPFYVPKTALERAIIEKAIPIVERPKITEAVAVKRLTISSRVKPGEFKSTMREVVQFHKISNVEKSLNAIISTLKAQEAEIYGSIVQKAAGRMVGEKGLARVPRDFDIKVADPKVFGEVMVTNINKAAAKEVVYLKKGNIYTKATGEKLFDIHTKESGVGSYSTEADFIAYGIRPGRLIKTEVGAKTITLAEQTSRKLEGAMAITAKERIIESPMMSVTGKIAPKHTGRVKDIQDFYFGEKVEIKVIRSRGNILRASRADVHLERWLDSWGGDVPSKVRKAYLTAEAKAVPEVKPLLYAPTEPGIVYPTVLRDVGRYVKFAPPAAKIPEVYKAPPYREPTYRLPYEMYPRVVPTYPVGIREAMYRIGEKYKPRKVVYPKVPKEVIPKYPGIPKIGIPKYPVIPTVPKITVPIRPIYPPPEAPPKYPPVVPPKKPPIVPYIPLEYVPEYYPYEPSKVPIIRILPPPVRPKIIPKKKRIVLKKVLPPKFFRYEEITRIRTPEEIMSQFGIGTKK